MSAPIHSCPAAVMAVILPIVGMTAAPAAAADYYAGKSIEMVIGFEAGGGFDIYARTLARHIAKHIPGRPTIVPKNMLGAGSVKAAGYIYAVAPKDGTSIGAISPGAIMAPLTEPEIAKQYDSTKFEYIGSTATASRFCATFHTSKVRTFADALLTESTIGATGAGGSTRYSPTVLNALAGTKFKIIAGYKGSTDILLAIERGEVDGICGYDWASFKTIQPGWIKDKKINILVQMGIEDEPELTGMGVPNIWGFLKGADDKRIFELMVGSDLFLRPYLMPPGTNPQAVTILREAITMTLKNKEFLAEAEKAQLFVSGVSGTAVQNLVNKLYSSPRSLVARFEAAIKN